MRQNSFFRVARPNGLNPFVETVTRDAESSSDFDDRMASLGHLADGFVLEFRSESLLAHGTSSDSSMLAIQVSTVLGEVQLEAHVRVDFAIPVSAWSGDLASLGPTTGVSVYDVADQLLGQTMLGDHAFRGFQLTGGDVGSYLIISRPDGLNDAIHINSMSIVPEPNTALMQGISVGLVGLAARRRSLRS